MHALLEIRSFTKDVFSTMMSIVEQKLNAKSLTPVNSDVIDIETQTSNHFLLGKKNKCLPYLSRTEGFVDH